MESVELADDGAAVVGDLAHQRQVHVGSETGAEEDLSVDLLALPNQGLPSGPTLEVYGTPVRLMVLVIAPVGRGEPPAQSQLPRIAEFLLPGLMSVLNSHQPLFRLWPSQLSASGFTHILNNNLRLPGDRGKGSPWCCVSGRFHAEGRTYLAGLVCVGEVENSLGSVTIEHDLPADGSSQRA